MKIILTLTEEEVIRGRCRPPATSGHPRKFAKFTLNPCDRRPSPGACPRDVPVAQLEEGLRAAFGKRTGPELGRGRGRLDLSFKGSAETTAMMDDLSSFIISQYKDLVANTSKEKRLPPPAPRWRALHSRGTSWVSTAPRSRFLSVLKRREASLYRMDRGASSV